MWKTNLNALDPTNAPSRPSENMSKLKDLWPGKVAGPREAGGLPRLLRPEALDKPRQGAWGEGTAEAV